MNTIDLKSVEDFFNLVYVDGFCCEVRCFNSTVDSMSHMIVRSKDSHTVAGWFTSFAYLRCELSRIKDVSCYISVNPVKLERRPVLGKNNLRFLPKDGYATDSDIDHIRHIIIDIDPIRLPSKSKLNSTNQELFECINVRDKIIADLDLRESCVYGISGNGAFILIDTTEERYENNETTRAEIFRFINYISQRYSNQHCRVDTNPINASRMLGIPGTYKYKDVFSTPDRPHRRVELHGLGGNDGQSSQAEKTVQS